MIKKKFSAFGSILFARENTFLGSNTKSRIVTLKMVISSPIPSYVHFGTYCLIVNHDNQPQTCRKCDSPDHLAKETAQQLDASIVENVVTQMQPVKLVTNGMDVDHLTTTWCSAQLLGSMNRRMAGRRRRTSP